MKEYYTYAYLREDGTPYYIGKGSKERAQRKSQRTVPAPTNPKNIIMLKQNLSEEDAFKHEIYMINVFGRKDNGTGILRNLTDGGEGGKGVVWSQERHNRHRDRMLGNKQCVGRTLSSETKEKMAAAKRGKTLSEETRKKMSNARKGRKFPREVIK